MERELSQLQLMMDKRQPDVWHYFQDSMAHSLLVIVYDISVSRRPLSKSKNLISAGTEGLTNKKRLKGSLGFSHYIADHGSKFGKKSNYLKVDCASGREVRKMKL